MIISHTRYSATSQVQSSRCVSAHRTIPEFISFSLATVNFGGLHLPGISRCSALCPVSFRVTPASTPLGPTGNIALTGYQALTVAYSDTNGTFMRRRAARGRVRTGPRV
jgi:hypothetical protein